MIDDYFGKDYLKFVPVKNGITEDGLMLAESSVEIDGWFTLQQLKNIVYELERQEAEMKPVACKICGRMDADHKLDKKHVE